MRHQCYIALCVLLGMFGCKPMADFQVNPNEASAGNPALFLTKLEQNLFLDVHTRDPIYGENQFLAARYWVGSNFHGEAYQYYRWGEGSFNKYNYLRNVQEMERWADGNANYSALAKLFRSLFFYDLTMRFGDIPYAQALKLADGVSAPAYDTQKAVFLGILDELEAANALLAESTGIIQGDFVYNGDRNKWRKFVNSFKLRVLLSLSRKAEDTDLDIKGRFVQLMQDPQRYPLFESNADNAQRLASLVAPTVYYSNSALIYMGLEHRFAEDLKSLRDPRLKHYASITSAAAAEGKTAADFSAFAGLPGAAPNEQNTLRFNQVSLPNRGYIDVANYEPVLYMGYYEVNFLIAEAIVRGWWPQGDAEAHYQAGVRASLAYWSIPTSEIDAYLQQPSVRFDAASALQCVLMQKYYAAYQNSGFESYYTIRRTGIPTIDVSGDGMIEKRMAIRWRYPQSEYLLNGQAVEQAVSRQYNGVDDTYGTMWILQ